MKVNSSCRPIGGVACEIVGVARSSLAAVGICAMCHIVMQPYIQISVYLPVWLSLCSSRETSWAAGWSWVKGGSVWGQNMFSHKLNFLSAVKHLTPLLQLLLHSQEMYKQATTITIKEKPEKEMVEREREGEGRKMSQNK